jgi:carboxyl-terminal processing protease
MHLPFKKTRLVFAGVVCFSVNVLGEKNEADEEEQVGTKTELIYRWLRTFAETTATVEKKAFRNVDFAKFMTEGLKSAVSSIDAHSSFIENFEEISDSTSGSFSGIGVSVIAKSPEDEAILVVDVLDDSPSQKAGMKAGDKIVGVDDEKVRGMTTDEVVRKMKGKKGSTVKLKIIRSKKPIEIAVTRDTINDQNSMCYYLPDQDVCYFSLRMFSENSAAQFKELFLKCKRSKNCKGVILDLRDNPGGVLESAVEMASLFLPKNSLIVTTKDRSNKLMGEYKTTSEPIFDAKIPLFILINNFTASASEILAGCLRYHSAQENYKAAKRTIPMVFVVGTGTHGKGSVQEVIPVSNGCALKLTTMLYFLPGDSCIQEIGVKPDFEIKPRPNVSKEMRWIAELYGKEESLRHHITHQEVEEIKKGKAPSLASKVDKQQEKKRRELEAAKEKDEEDEEDPGELKDKDGEKEAVDFEKKREELISKSYLVQICTNMISVFDVQMQKNPNSVSSRQQAIEFLKRNFVLDEGLNLEKIK